MSTEEFTGHVRAMRADNEYFGAEDLIGLPDTPFRIVKCNRYTNHKACGKTQPEMFTLTLQDKSGRDCSKQLWLKATNRRSIVALYGGNVAEWKGKWIWLYVTKVRSPQGGDTLGIRIRERTDPPGKEPQPNATP